MIVKSGAALIISGALFTRWGGALIKWGDQLIKWGKELIKWGGVLMKWGVGIVNLETVKKRLSKNRWNTFGVSCLWLCSFG